MDTNSTVSIHFYRGNDDQPRVDPTPDMSKSDETTLWFGTHKTDNVERDDLNNVIVYAEMNTSGWYITLSPELVEAIKKL